MSNPGPQDESPKWMKRALLGACYWIGHRRTIYKGYPLTEGAIVAELCNLIHANFREGELECEHPYAEFVPASDVCKERSRVDLCIYETTSHPPERKCRYVIEVKRWQSRSSPASIQNDLKRLAEVKCHHPEIRTMLLLVAEGLRPKPYVGEDGRRSRKRFPLDDRQERAVYSVLNVQRVAPTNSRCAHYACSLEVTLKAVAR